MQSTPRRRSLPRQTWQFLLLLFAMMLVTVAQVYYRIRFSGSTAEYEFFPQLAIFHDLQIYRTRFSLFGTDAFFHFGGPAFNYPAPMSLVYRLLYMFHATRITIAVLLVFICIMVVKFVQACKRRHVATGAAVFLAVCAFSLCYPLYVLTYLLNFEIFVWILCSLGIWAYLTGREWLAALCFGTAGALKYFPLAFLGLFPWTQWRKIVVGIATCVVLIVSSLWFMGPSIVTAATGLGAETTLFVNTYVVTWRRYENGLEHSIFGFIKLMFVNLHREDLVPALLHSYLPIAGIAAVAIYIWRIRLLPVLNRLLALTVLALWIMPISYDYTLVHLFAPLAAITLYFIDAENVIQSRANLIYLCFALSLGSLTFLERHGTRYGGQVRCIALGILFAIALRWPMPGRDEIISTEAAERVS